MFFKYCTVDFPSPKEFHGCFQALQAAVQRLRFIMLAAVTAAAMNVSQPGGTPLAPPWAPQAARFGLMRVAGCDPPRAAQLSKAWAKGGPVVQRT